MRTMRISWAKLCAHSTCGRIFTKELIFTATVMLKLFVILGWIEFYRVSCKYNTQSSITSPPQVSCMFFFKVILNSEIILIFYLYTEFFLYAINLVLDPRLFSSEACSEFGVCPWHIGLPEFPQAPIYTKSLLVMRGECNTPPPPPPTAFLRKVVREYSARSYWSTTEGCDRWGALAVLISSKQGL